MKTLVDKLRKNQTLSKEEFVLYDMEQIKYSSYIEYGRRFEQLLKDCGW